LGGRSVSTAGVMPEAVPPRKRRAQHHTKLSVSHGSQSAQAVSQPSCQSAHAARHRTTGSDGPPSIIQAVSQPRCQSAQQAGSQPGTDGLPPSPVGGPPSHIAHGPPHGPPSHDFKLPPATKARFELAGGEPYQAVSQPWRKSVCSCCQSAKLSASIPPGRVTGVEWSAIPRGQAAAHDEGAVRVAGRRAKSCCRSAMAVSLLTLSVS
jgi:hypothetical protein